MNEFNSFNSFLSNVRKDMTAHKYVEYSRKASGTDDDYKNAIAEKTQFFYSLNDARDVVSNFSSLKQHSFWTVGEIISEIFAFNPPLMYKYKPEVIEWSYKLRADKSVEYMYGRRWNEWNQILNTIEILSKRLDSKRAVIDIFTPYDTDVNRTDVPCTLMYEFKLRDNKLNMTTFLRSHDIFSGLKYDVLLSSFICQLIALGINTKIDERILPGKLNFYEGSLHYYKNKDSKLINTFLSEEADYSNKCYFDLMKFQYNKIENIFDDLWNVNRVEESSFYGNFNYAKKEIEKILNPSFRDFARVFYNRNLSFNVKSNNIIGVDKENYETNILKW